MKHTPHGYWLEEADPTDRLAPAEGEIDADVIGKGIEGDNGVDNAELIVVNDAIRNHPVEIVGKTLRSHMTAMKRII